jgi:hypothetical protein
MWRCVLPAGGTATYRGCSFAPAGAAALRPPRIRPQRMRCAAPLRRAAAPPPNKLAAGLVPWVLGVGAHAGAHIGAHVVSSTAAHRGAYTGAAVAYSALHGTCVCLRCILRAAGAG